VLALQQAPDRTCGPMERGTHTGAGLLAGLVNLQGPHTKGLQAVGRTHVGAIHGGLCAVGGTPRWSRGRV